MALSITEFARMGGKARAKKLSKKERSDSARKAVEARWSKEKQKLDSTLDRLEAANRRSKTKKKKAEK